MQCVFQVRRYLFRVCISRVWKQRERTNKEKREEKKKIKRDKGKKLDIGIIFEREARLQPSDFQHLQCANLPSFISVFMYRSNIWKNESYIF